MSKTVLIDSVTDIGQNADGLFIKKQQFIPQSFMDDIRREKDDSLNTKCGEMYRVARIPVAVIDKWDREGFDYNRVPIRDILNKLAKEQLDAFITTKKRI